MNWDYYIDASTTNMGIVLCNSSSKKVIVTSLNFSKFKDDAISNAEHQALKLKYIYKTLESFKKKYRASNVVIEGSFVQTQYRNSSEIVLKLHGILIALFYAENISYIPPSTVKKVITGNGQAKKDEIKEHLEHKYNIEFCNKDESDAFALMIADLTRKGKNLDEYKILCINS